MWALGVASIPDFDATLTWKSTARYFSGEAVSDVMKFRENLLCIVKGSLDEKLPSYEVLKMLRE